MQQHGAASLSQLHAPRHVLASMDSTKSSTKERLESRRSADNICRISVRAQERVSVSAYGRAGVCVRACVQCVRACVRACSVCVQCVCARARVRTVFCVHAGGGGAGCRGDYEETALVVVTICSVSTMFATYLRHLHDRMHGVCVCVCVCARVHSFIL